MPASTCSESGESGTENSQTELHIGDAGLWIPPAFRKFDRQLVIRTPRSTIQHYSSELDGLDPYYGLVTQADFEFEDEDNVKNPELLSNKVSLKKEGEDAVVFSVELNPDVRV